MDMLSYCTIFLVWSQKVINQGKKSKPNDFINVLNNLIYKYTFFHSSIALCNCLCKYFALTSSLILIPPYLTLLIICSCWWNFHHLFPFRPVFFLFKPYTICPFIGTFQISCCRLYILQALILCSSRQSRRDSCHISISCWFYNLSVQPFTILCYHVPWLLRKYFWKWHISHLSIVNWLTQCSLHSAVMSVTPAALQY